MKTVLLFARDPGGANAIIPLIEPLLARGLHVELFGKGVALDRYRQAGYEGSDITGLIPVLSPKAVRAFLEKKMPNIVITGTSADDFTEKFLWLAASELAIPSMAIIDQWVNYGLRFSEQSVSGISEYLHNRKHPYLPTHIIAMDEFARSEMIAEELPAERIKVCGQPYFETLRAYGKTAVCGVAGADVIPSIANDDFVVVFASEPITATYGDNAQYWGYTERTIFTSVAETLETISRTCGRSILLIIRPHPKEDPHGLVDIAATCCKNINWRIDTECHSWTLINRADVVCGMSSMFLIEALIMGRTTLTIQIGLCRENPFILDRRGILKSIIDQPALLSCLTSIINGNKQQVSTFEVISNPVERIISDMETLLCRN